MLYGQLKHVIFSPQRVKTLLSILLVLPERLFRLVQGLFVVSELLFG